MEDIKKQEIKIKGFDSESLEKYLLFVFVVEDKGYTKDYAVISDGIHTELKSIANNKKVFSGAFIECLKVIDSLKLCEENRESLKNIITAWENLTAAADEIAKAKGLDFMSETAVSLFAVRLIGEKIKNGLEYPINNIAYLLDNKDVKKQILEELKKRVY